MNNQTRKELAELIKGVAALPYDMDPRTKITICNLAWLITDTIERLDELEKRLNVLEEKDKGGK